MLSLPGNSVRCCEGVSRREWLRAGGLSALGLSLPDMLTARAEAAGDPRHAASFGRAKACIVCFLFGAPAHQDIWDLKPDAPSEVRGEFKPIDSSVSGTLLGEHIPRLAQAAHRYAIVRSVQHADNTHTVAMHHMLTGRRHLRPNSNPQNQASDFPTFGAVLQRLRPSTGCLPSGISLNAPANQVSANNHIFPGFFAGWLGSAYDPLFVARDPSATDFQPFAPAEGSTAVRLGKRRDLLAEMDRLPVAEGAAARGLLRHYQQAFDLVSSPAAQRAFDLTLEPPPLRDRYGSSAFGQGCLLARRLVEAGVPLVTVNWARDDAFWDTHANNFKLLKEKLLPPFDTGFSALLEDLEQRGLLDETLVVCLGEFGRTPKINAAAGRDHWAACNSVVLAGAGIRGGLVHGASDRTAAYPATTPVTPDDLAATIYHALGIDPGHILHDHLKRPHRLCEGTPLMSLF